jgi:S1-C subfamily serine protease
MSNVRPRDRPMITFNVFDRVFFVRGAQYGTAFTVDVDDRQYLVSAAHVVGAGQDAQAIKIFIRGQWVNVPVAVVGSGRGEIDITVLSPKIRLSTAHPLPADTAGLVLGQDVFFVGYPYKMWSDGGEVMHGRPLPFIKKGTLSAAFDANDSVKRLYVDAINNEGFSGGPIVFTQSGKLAYQVVGVVSKFKTEYEPVIDLNGQPTGHRVAYNTGFLVGYSINHALSIIRANPVGLPVGEA